MSQKEYLSLFKKKLEERKGLVRQKDAEIKKLYLQLLKDHASDEGAIKKAFLNELTAASAEHGLVKNSHKYGGLKGVSSFRSLLTQRTRMQQLAGKDKCHEWFLNDKKKAYKFLDLLDVRRPQTSSKACDMDSLAISPGMAIKPDAGVASRGVYLVYDLANIWDVKKSKWIYSVNELKKEMRQNIKNRKVGRDSWLTEELIFGDSGKKSPTVDFKFLCFYGKVGLVREISRFPEVLDCWWDRNGNNVETGQRLNDKEILQGMGVSQKNIELVERISSEIPAPFMRIDFLYSDGDLVFGEFTPRPGSYDRFTESVDRELGEMFLSAEAKLVDDLLSGKEFDVYKKYMN